MRAKKTGRKMSPSRYTTHKLNATPKKIIRSRAAAICHRCRSAGPAVGDGMVGGWRSSRATFIDPNYVEPRCGAERSGLEVLGVACWLSAPSENNGSKPIEKNKVKETFKWAIRFMVSLQAGFASAACRKILYNLLSSIPAAPAAVDHGPTSISARPVSGSIFRFKCLGDSVNTTSRVGHTCASRT